MGSARQNMDRAGQGQYKGMTGQGREGQDRTGKGRKMQVRAWAEPDCGGQGQGRAGRCLEGPGKEWAG